MPSRHRANGASARDRRIAVRGRELADLRRSQYLTQEEFAQRLGMSVQNVRRLEQARVSGMQVRNFRRLAELVGQTPDQLRALMGDHGNGGWVRRLAGDAVESAAQPSSIRPGSIHRAVEIERFHGVSAARAEDRTGVGIGKMLVPPGSTRRFTAKVDGDCMVPKYHHGDEVVFSVDAVENEGIVEGRNYFIQFDDGENTFKRVFFHSDDEGLLVLRCWNSEYVDRVVERVRIVLLARAIYRLVPDE